MLNSINFLKFEVSENPINKASSPTLPPIQSSRRDKNMISKGFKFNIIFY